MCIKYASFARSALSDRINVGRFHVSARCVFETAEWILVKLVWRVDSQRCPCTRLMMCVCVLWHWFTWNSHQFSSQVTSSKLVHMWH